MKVKRTVQLFIIFLIAGMAEPCWALQSHGPPEGVYVHQMAHLLFSGALAYLFWHTRKRPALESKGWKYLQIFCVVLICWNLLAFIGHEAYGFLKAEDFVNTDSLHGFIVPPISAVKVLYYITKMDHLLNVPALLALVVSLRIFYLEALQEEDK